MKGVLLAGGTATRLYPVTEQLNKHILPIWSKPMIFYPIQTLIDMGIDDILIILGGNSAGDIFNLLKSGKRFDINITYRFQESADGIAGAIKLAKNFVGDNKFVTILGDNLYLTKDMFKYRKSFDNIDKNEAMCLLYEVEDPQRFGNARINNGKIIDIIEKPKVPMSNYAITGLYMLPPNIFSFLQSLKPSNRGELEITDILKQYMELGSLHYDIFDGYWSDMGVFETLLKASNKIKEWESK